MNSQFEGKVALVTGGNSLIGLATAKLFAQRGATIYITGRRQKELDEGLATSASRQPVFRGDVSRLADIDKFIRSSASIKANSIFFSPTQASAGSLGQI